MKLLTIILLVLFTVSFANGKLQLLNSAQVQKLAAVVSKQPPDSMDIIYYKTVRDLSKDRQFFKEIYEEAFTKMYGSEENLTPAKAERRNRMIQLNVERSMKEQEVGRKSKMRIRYLKDRQRVDYVGGIPARTIFKGTENERFALGKRLDADTPFTTSVVEITDGKNVSTRYKYLHESKSVSIKTIKRRDVNLTKKISGFSMIPSGVAGILRMKLSGGNSSGVLEPDESTMEQLRLGVFNGLGITIDKAANASDTTVQIEVILYSAKDVPSLQMAMVCDKDDYSRVHSYEGRTAGGVLIVRETRDNFDSQGFPHKVSVFTYDAAGKTTRHELYLIERVRLNIQIPPEDFELSSAKDYRVIDHEMTPAEHQAGEVDRLKRWLQDENWTRRMRGLVELKKHLKENPGELRDIASSMQNDENPQVRKTAAWILQALESNE